MSEIVKRMLRAMRRAPLSQKAALGIDSLGVGPPGWSVDEFEGYYSLIRHRSGRAQIIDYRGGWFNLYPSDECGRPAHRTRTLAECLKVADEQVEKGQHHGYDLR